MMQYSTPVELPEYPWQFDHVSELMLMGSCFAENIGQKLSRFKYNVDVNPFGILYNPVSVANSLKILLGQRYFTKNDLAQRNGLWFSFNHHSRFSSKDAEQTLLQINEHIKSASEKIVRADYLFLTFGTAWVYELKSTGQVVSNCHKVASSEFSRYRLPVVEIVEIYTELIEELHRKNPRLKIIFTVSPIRHWQDGAIENHVSKATLLLAINHILENVGKKMCNYFPSYEIVMDELRDYRYYADDMIHLSPLAVNHIWNKFQEVLIQKKAIVLSAEIEKIVKAVEHRPFNSDTLAHQRFLKKSIETINKLTLSYPYLNFKLEKDYLFSQIENNKG